MKIKNINIKEQIRNYFFVNPNDKMRLREIEKKLKLPLPSIIRYCKELKQEGILTTIVIGKAVFFTADKTSSNFILEKKIYNLKSLYASKLIDYLKTELSNPSIIVFGSYARGEDNEKSDIDLYIETPSKKEINLKDFERILKRNIQIFRHKNFFEIKNKELMNNIANGILLNGFVEVIR
jgi:predicted nucleotidyltransferase